MSRAYHEDFWSGVTSFAAFFPPAVAFSRDAPAGGTDIHRCWFIDKNDVTWIGKTNNESSIIIIGVVIKKNV